ncbi:unnamed protein product [Musa acuminata subsp. malaccensis]|uniref:(wild Malaysian banana) hypothetical protein n=1 Tax=Musa acuminata subsp. malaccensis TaxID=214687 RepID=A0A8D7AR45_MUSAM|nr:unnamed protein product [Musa acuminata subsp. malaccensis]
MKTENCFAAPPLAEGAAAQPSSADRTARGASKYLAGLPSRGLFSSAVLSSNPGGIRVYVCDHETAPPEGQVIKTNSTNILIRALQINKQKSDAKDVIAKSAADSSTVKSKEFFFFFSRSAVRTSERRSPPKKMKTSSASTSSCSSELSEKKLQTMTVERLRALLKERGLSPKGKKDELIARLKDEA